MTPESFDANPLWNVLDSATDQMTLADATNGADISSKMDEIRELVAYTKSFRENLELNRVTTNMLNGVSNAWNNVYVALSNFVSTHQVVYLDQALGGLDAVRDQLATLPLPASSASARKAANKQLADYLALLNESRGYLEESLRRSQQMIADMQNDYTSASADVAALEEQVATAVKRTDAAAVTSNDAFLSAQTLRETTFTTWLSSQGSSFAELAQPSLDAAKKVATEADEILKKIRSLGSNVTDMSGLVAGDILGKSYGKSADQDRLASYYGYAIGGVIGISALLVLLFAFGGIGPNLTWQEVAIKLSVTVAAGGLTAVAFRFAGQAVSRATSFRRQELELRALRPLLSEVENSDTAILEFFTRSFGNSWLTTGQDQADASAVVTGDGVIKLLTAAVERIPKS